MIATKSSFESGQATDAAATANAAPETNPVAAYASALPNSRRVYVQGQLHPDVRVPMREIQLAPTKLADGRVEVNEPVRVYDTRGPWGDPDFHGDVTRGLPPLRRDWILRRGDVEEYDGRPVRPEDDGYLSEQHRALARARRQDDPGYRLEGLTAPRRRPLRASKGHPVTQLWYARQGIITPEMEFVAIRENMG
ncbi:MAG: hypothetical protein RMK20_11200, partial [Verrucomicrobiales bacterium]|nr:hypothetical protein [Verrucomicrobiales bacterium]